MNLERPLSLKTWASTAIPIMSAAVNQDGKLVFGRDNAGDLEGPTEHLPGFWSGWILLGQSRAIRITIIPSISILHSRQGRSHQSIHCFHWKISVFWDKPVVELGGQEVHIQCPWLETQVLNHLRVSGPLSRVQELPTVYTHNLNGCQGRNVKFSQGFDTFYWIDLSHNYKMLSCSGLERY